MAKKSGFGPSAGKQPGFPLLGWKASLAPFPAVILLVVSLAVLLDRSVAMVLTLALLPICKNVFSVYCVAVTTFDLPSTTCPRGTSTTTPNCNYYSLNVRCR